MNQEVAAALVASVAAIMSGGLAGAISWFASTKAIRAEVEKMRLGLRHIQAQPLQSERLRTYPLLYRLLSDSVKRIESQGARGIDLAKLKDEVDDWDSSYSLFLSAPSTRVVYGFRRHLSSLFENGNSLDSPEVQREFIQQIAKAELALKSDLAVFGLDLYSPEKIWQTYSEVEGEYDRTQSRMPAPSNL